MIYQVYGSIFLFPTDEVMDIESSTSIWKDGIGFDGSSIQGFQKIQEIVFT